MRESLLRVLPTTHTAALIFGICLALAIALADWLVFPSTSVGVLYFLPVVIAAGPLSVGEVLCIAALCSLLQETFRPAPWQNDPLSRLLVSLVGFSGTGLLMRETFRLRAIDRQNARNLATEIARREEAEASLAAQIEAMPAAMLTVDTTGRITMANKAAHILLGTEDEPLRGQQIATYLPEIARLRKNSGARRLLRTMIEGTGYRQNREPFLAHIWVSSFTSPSQTGLIVVTFDSSEELRRHEEGGLYSLTNSARMLMSALWHETRNVASAMRVLVTALAHHPDAGELPEVEGLSSLVTSLEKVAYAELRPSDAASEETASVRLVAEHLRIVIESSFREQDIAIAWNLAPDLPLVTADNHSLLQVFLNLTRNAAKALEGVERKRLDITAYGLDGLVWIKFKNNGPPISEPDKLFKAITLGETGSGLGLYVSRAIMRSYGGDLMYEPLPDGCSFAVKLHVSPLWRDLVRDEKEEHESDSHSSR